MRRRIVALVVLLVLSAAYWFTTGGFPDRSPAAWLTERVIAHRGAWTEGSLRPENSLAAFEEAARRGYAIELDVQFTVDGQVVVFHDDDLSRMTGLPGALRDATLADVRRARLLGGNETIPTLSDALRVIAGRVPVFVEIKNRGSVGPLEDAVARQISAYSGPAAVMAFNPFSLARIAEHAPHVPRGQLSSALRGEGLRFYEVILLSNLMMNWTSKPDFIGYDLAELPTLGTTLQRWRGRPLVGWTAETDAQRRAAEDSCDAVECGPGALP
jgi:glycerophosphoryl diester phosphodiesterase